MNVAALKSWWVGGALTIPDILSYLIYLSIYLSYLHAAFAVFSLDWSEMLVPALALSVLCYVPSLGGVGGVAQTPAVASRAAVSLISLPWRAKNQKKSEPEVSERRQLRAVLQSFSRDDVLWPGASQLVSEFMTPNVDLLTFDPDMCLKEAATLLVAKGVAGCPVVKDGRLVGVISQTDMLFKLAGTRSLKLVGPRSERYMDNTKRIAKIKGSTVRDSMTASPKTIAPTTTIKDAAGRMLRFGHNRLMVVEGGRLVGLLSATDVIKLALCDEDGCDDLY